jgi:hypothetical protein
MAERSRSPGRGGFRARVVLALLAAAIGAPALASCQEGSDSYSDDSDARTLDGLCARTTEGGLPACETSGGAKRTTGISEDTTGFHLGTDGVLTIHLAALANETGLYGATDLEVQVLVAATSSGATLTATTTWGSCTEGCPTDPAPTTTTLSEEYGWTTVLAQSAPSYLPMVPEDAVLTLSGTGIDLADLRTRSNHAASCSIAGPVGARR